MYNFSMGTRRDNWRFEIEKLPPEGTAARPFSPFWFSVEPWDTLAVRGAPALLNCSAHSGDPASEPTAPQARVEWKKDGTFLSLAPDDGRRRILPDGSLLISSVVHSKHNKPDEGTYQCVATIDSLGTIASRTARLTVAAIPHSTRSHGLTRHYHHGKSPDPSGHTAASK
ncbi:neogenin-like [Oncorhynchus masou masou]|uniref:neogenin-like n=1 Tax=Oncorhynchus masou masou TaxID=90313 RepID=UPI003182BC97